jgi:hypothetical protein
LLLPQERSAAAILDEIKAIDILNYKQQRTVSCFLPHSSEVQPTHTARDSHPSGTPNQTLAAINGIKELCFRQASTQLTAAANPLTPPQFKVQTQEASAQGLPTPQKSHLLESLEAIFKQAECSSAVKEQAAPYLTNIEKAVQAIFRYKGKTHPENFAYPIKAEKQQLANLAVELCERSLPRNSPVTDHILKAISE